MIHFFERKIGTTISGFGNRKASRSSQGFERRKQTNEIVMDDESGGSRRRKYAPMYDNYIQPARRSFSRSRINTPSSSDEDKSRYERSRNNYVDPKIRRKSEGRTFTPTTREDWGKQYERSQQVYEPYENERRPYLTRRNVYSSPDDRPEYQVDPVERNFKRSTRQRQDTIELNKFDGGNSGQPLEAFLVQFDNAASFNNWSINDCLSHLKASLSGSASQLLWESPAHHFTFTELVERLKQRFGSAGQSAQHRVMDAENTTTWET